MAGSEAEAKRLALASWIAITEHRHGVRYTSWRLAYSKALDCTTLARDRVRCTAVGRPCTISQVTPPDWRSHPDLVPVPAPRMR